MRIVGIQAVVDTAKQLGIHSQLPAVPSVALGSGGVTLLEMTRAFAAIATNTTNIDSYTVRSITKKGDQIVYSRQRPKLNPTDNPAVHAEMLDLLSNVVRAGTGRAARLEQPVGGKTGTSEDYRDAWFIGFTSDLVVGVWVGNDDNSPMNGVVGGGIPATIWHDFVTAAESMRRPKGSPDATQMVSSSVPTINFDTAVPYSANDEDRGRRYSYGWRPPIRPFGFRF